MMTRSETSAFWQGRFGDEYNERNRPQPEARAPFFRHILELAPDIRSVCELGPNKGHNLSALRLIDPALELTGVEVNETAAAELAKLPGMRAVCANLHDFAPGRTFDLVFTCGVLIHQHPDELASALTRLVALSGRYVLINEYFSPEPAEIPYRGFAGKLFKRDFGRALLERCGDDVRLVDYGFLWRVAAPAWDDTTWWLFRKTSGTDKKETAP